MGEKYQSPWLEGEGWNSMVKTYTLISLQYTYTLTLEGGIPLAQLRSSTDRPNGGKCQSPRLEGEGWSSMVKTHTTASPQNLHTLPLEGGIALTQLHSSTNGPNGEKKPKSMVQD
jgi:hypothetical protein